MMNKTITKVLLALVGLICLYSLFSFFYISGAELPGLSSLSPERCTAKIFSAGWEYPEDLTEYILDYEEFNQLAALLKSSSFTRFLRSGKPVQIADGTKLYTVCFYFEDPEEDTLILHITGNEYFSSSALAGGSELKIMNRSAWKTTFESILSE